VKAPVLSQATTVGSILENNPYAILPEEASPQEISVPSVVKN